MDDSLQQIGEDLLVEQLISLLPQDSSLRQGPGDDCAVAPRDKEWDSLLKTDVIVEGVHFLPCESPERIGYKALARALSDIAAMGGIPEYALITLLADSAQKKDKIIGIYQGILRCAGLYEVTIAGGETSSLPSPGLIINIALTGRVEREQAILRSTALPGDLVFVTGELGGSLRGHHLDFLPRLNEGRFLLASGAVHAMMDISDGLAKDLPRMASASGTGFYLNPSQLPIRPGCTTEQALGDGEDYELLLTIPPELSDNLLDSWSPQFPRTRLTCIGEITDSCLRGNTPASGGWEHFLSR